MVKFSGVTNEGKGRLIGIALSRKNCEKLLDGQPIAFDLAELGLRVQPVGEPYPLLGHVVIVAGETEQEIMDELQEIARKANVAVSEL